MSPTNHALGAKNVMNTDGFLQRLFNGYRARKVREFYYEKFYSRPKPYTVHYNEITGPYRLVMRVADGPGMRQRLREGTEMPQRRVFLPLLAPGFFCCDVGAHVGDYTVEMAMRVGPQGRVFAYEAVPYWFDMLQKSVEANRLTNVVTQLAAVGARRGKVRIPSEMLTGNIAKPGKVQKSHSGTKAAMKMAEVPVVRLDDELDHLDAIKVDCEGYEVEVLKGMEKLLSKNPKLVLFLEVHARQLRDVGSSLSDLACLLLQTYRLKVHQISVKHCICSGVGLSLASFPEVISIEKFVSNFRNT